ncbi:MAG: hypothetical protein ABJB03_01865 [Rhodoglobus sp.]
MVTAYDVPALTPLPGDAAALTQFGTRYAGVAEAIAAITVQLDFLVNDDITIGDAADALRTRTAGAAREIRVVLPRYRQSAIAISEFATVLADAQQRANAVISQHGPLHDELLRLYDRRTHLEYAIQDAQYQPDPATIIAPLARRLNGVHTDIADGEARLYTIWMAYLDADGDRGAAGNAAAARIVAGAAGSTDSVFDYLASWWSDVTALAGIVDQWIREVLSNVLFYMALVEILVLTLAFVAIAAVVLLGTPLGWILLASVLSGDLDLMDVLEGVFAAVILIVPPLSLWTQLLLQWEANAPTPQMNPVEPYWGTEVVKEDENGDPLGNYEHTMVTNNELDDEGKMDSTVVQVVKVYNDDGTFTWRVTLPSTQDWMLPINGSEFFEHGAANDLASNLTLILSPDQQAAYERMVLDAMAQAGIGPEDPVMLVGFSQGGILAGKLASQDDGFNIQAIVTAGAPIDAYDIPDDVSVISMQHNNDIVARLDGTPAVHGDNWQTVEVPAPVNTHPPYEQLPDHNGTAYEITALSELDNPDPNNAGLLAVIADQQQFFSDNEVAYTYEGAEDLVML